MFSEGEMERELSPHDENCAFCDAVVTLFKVLTGLLMRMQSNVPPIKFNQALYKLRRSEYHINDFKGFQMRAKITRTAWHNLRERSESSWAFVLFDFPMKYFLKQYRGTTKDWFSQVCSQLAKGGFEPTKPENHTICTDRGQLLLITNIAIFFTEGQQLVQHHLYQVCVEQRQTVQRDL